MHPFTFFHFYAFKEANVTFLSSLPPKQIIMCFLGFLSGSLDVFRLKGQFWLIQFVTFSSMIPLVHVVFAKPCLTLYLLLFQFVEVDIQFERGYDLYMR